MMQHPQPVTVTELSGTSRTSPIRTPDGFAECTTPVVG
jgi:hypothetical protein